MAYVYRHIRLDKNEPFYIGISNDDKYRATTKRKRNVIWTRIVNKTDYEVEILFDDLTWKEACLKELEFIYLYGRIDLQTGTLANMTNGGEGTVGRKYIPSETHKLNLSIASKGKKMSDVAKNKMSKSKKVAVLQFDLLGNFIKEHEGIVDASKEFCKQNSSTSIMRCCKGKYKQAYGFVWKYKNK
jgi:hypothetical protein